MGSTCCKGKPRNHGVDGNGTKTHGSGSGMEPEAVVKAPVKDPDSDKIVPSDEDKRADESPIAKKTAEPAKSEPPKIQAQPTPISKIRPKMPRIRKMASSAPEFWSQAVNELGWDLLHQITAENREDNVVFSPLAIAMALALVESGADKETQNEIRQLFGQKATDNVKPTEMLGKLRSKVQTPKVVPGEGGAGAVFDACNLFFADDLKLKQEFMDATKQRFKTQPVTAPFRTQPEPARCQINKCVADLTKSKIPELIKKDAIDKHTSCLVVSAMYLNMDWAVPFDAKRTESRPFYRCGTEEKQIAQYMYRCAEGVLYVFKDNVHYVELPYAWDALSMYIVVPKQQDQIAKVEQMEMDQLLGMFRAVSPSNVRLEIPRFAINMSIKLLPILNHLGVRNWKNLSRMTTDSRAAISDIIHGSYIKVQEKASEGPLKTPHPVLPYPESSHKWTSVFADHPFLFAVMHKPTSTILYMGKVNGVE